MNQVTFKPTPARINFLERMETQANIIDRMLIAKQHRAWLNWLEDLSKKDSKLLLIVDSEALEKFSGYWGYLLPFGGSYAGFLGLDTENPETENMEAGHLETKHTNIHTNKGLNPMTDNETSTPETLEEFKIKPCALPFTHENYEPPTPGDIRALKSLMSWTNKHMALLTGNEYNPKKGSETVRRWMHDSDHPHSRKIGYAIWRILLIEALIVKPGVAIKLMTKQAGQQTQTPKQESDLFNK